MAGSFTVEVHHLGRFVENPVRYVEGVVNHVDDCDSDLWSKLEVEDIVERLGYRKYKMLWYRIPGLGLEEGLRVIETETDKDAMHMVAVVKGHGQIEIYLEHVIDEPGANANVMPFPALPPPEMPEGVEIHIDEEVVNGENVYYNSDTDESLTPAQMSEAEDDAVRRRAAVAEYRKKLLQHKELESRVKSVRESLRSSKKEFNKTEDDLKSLQSVGQIIGEVLRPLDNERLIVKASSGPRYVVGCRSKVDKEKLTSGTRVVLDMTTLTIMRALPREVDPVVYNMLHEDPGNISYSAVGGLSDQIRELRESIELPLMNPELFLRVGITPPKGVLLYGPPGTGKTLLARAIASNIDANFLKVVSSAIIDKYIGESARLIREMFGYARDHQPCIIFMDEIDAIGGRRFSEGTSADREIQRTLMELLNQLDGFDRLGKVKMIMATNRPDVLDPALLRPGRLDRKIEIPLPNEQSRMEILKIHAAGIAKHGEIDYEAVIKLAEGFNGADLRNVCTEAGMSAIRAERDYVIHEDFMKAVRKLNEAKKLESTAHYNTDFGKD
ncbi:hypothetical protein RHSIM_Rhsim07G0242400 [Rhododendron simsii]|uniref:AAA+ ATPase domain-containing protein n=1 Tax=Rhododendron simsii TaxID=118357 RepID=A0A834LJI3_RHOSS|nr:hypothetical protein RHSIM_Rhsim07G0242400 [Rhododendron simsii]